MSFADECVDRDRRPLLLLWGDSTAGALMPGLRKAQQSRDFGIAQLTASSCIPALNVDIPATPSCRANNDACWRWRGEIKPDIVLLHGTWEKYLDHVAETVAALKRQTDARVVVLGPVPAWRRGLPNEVLRYFMLHHRLIPAALERRGIVQCLRCDDARNAGAARCASSFPRRTPCATRRVA